MSLREAINAKCRDCVHDPAAPGTWLQQVTLCACHRCPLFPVRPMTKSPIPETTLSAHGLTREAWAEDSRGTSEKRPICPSDGANAAAAGVR